MKSKFWKAAFMFGLPWAIVMIIIKFIMDDEVTFGVILSTLVSGIFVGILFAWSMQYAAKFLVRSIIIETAANENIIKEAGANHFRGLEGVGGKLVLTDQRLLFKSHKFNVQNHEESFDLSQVERIEANKTLNVLENALILELTNKEKHKFVVDEPNDWVARILNQKQRVN